jgi:protein-L-isoaspartate(D-aspartate) O-methyltransferase
MAPDDHDPLAALIRSHQEHLLASTHEYVLQGDRVLSARVKQAFLAVPRHWFVKRYRYFGSANWLHVDDANLREHLPAIYRDDGLGIAGTDGDDVVATISRPACVLYMLELLQVEPGHRVFEVGAGSGWNAALLGHLAGPHGHVQSVEIIPELAERAARAIANNGLANVQIMRGDAALGARDSEPFDRVVFTAGAYDLPAWLHDRVRTGGLLLMVLKFPGGGDVLLLFERHADHFESITARSVEFVTMTGQSLRRELEPTLLEAFPPWARVREQPAGQRPFPCGGRARAELAARTFAMRSFLAIAEPRMRWFVEPEGWPFYSFGLWDEASGSLALARDNVLASFGGTAASAALMARLHEWVELGMPGAASMPVRAFRAGQAPRPGPGEFLMSRGDSEFLWSTTGPSADSVAPRAGL